MSTIPPETSAAAALYALGELGRRAGCTAAEIAAWRVSFAPDRITLLPHPERDCAIVFPWDPRKPARFASLRESVAKYAWMAAAAGGAQGVPFFIVPYERGSTPDTPLFQRIDDAQIRCNADVITATLWTLSRVEELFSENRDQHGRYAAGESLAQRQGFLERPIVDEYGLGLEQALIALMPARPPAQRSLRLKLTHDIDLTGYPRSARTTLGHLYPRRLPVAFARDALSAAGFGLPAYARAILETAAISQERGLHSAFYWQASARSAFDSGYDVAAAPLARIVRNLEERGFEMGAHPGYGTYENQQALESELGHLREVFAAPAAGGRQHFLRWSPATWTAWERAGMKYDSTVGYADAVGFRAGTCIPYHPWIVHEDRESQLLEVPLIVMDCTPIAYMQLTPAQTLERIRALVSRCAAAGGVFTLLWHNASVIEIPYRALYPSILNMLADARVYDWHEDAAIAPRPHATSAAQAL